MSHSTCHLQLASSNIVQAGIIGLVDEWNDLDQGWTWKTHGGWTYRRLHLSRQEPPGLDPFVDDELYLHIRHRILEIRCPRLLLAPLSILRYPNTHPDSLMCHSFLVPITIVHGNTSMPAHHSNVGWNAR